jgi:succinate dehydrogenase/fumarate reductase flavoprotein subunit
MVEMHISEIGLCSGHSASGVRVDEFGRTTVPGLYAAGDMGSVPHNYMLGAFVNGGIAGADAARYCGEVDLAALDTGAVAKEQERVLAPTRRDDGLTPFELEYKTRRMVNDYLQPPKVTRKMEIGMQRFAEVREDLGAMVARDPHELMRALEVHSILDCAEMAATASLFRTESRWGLYHHRVDFPERDQENWFCHSALRMQDGVMACTKRPIEPYLVQIAEEQAGAYDRLRVRTANAA